MNNQDHGNTEHKMMITSMDMDLYDVLDLIEDEQRDIPEATNLFEEKERTGIFDTSGYPKDCFSDISEDLICGICREVVRNPLNLPCPHLFCENCLKMHCASGAGKKCPICRIMIPVDKLPISSYSAKIVSALPIRCPYHNKGCKWTGTIGLGESILMKHLRDSCEWGGYEYCKACGLGMWKTDTADHINICREKESKCNFCDFRGPNKAIFVHKAIGEYSQKVCESMQLCSMLECKTLVPIGKLENHLKSKCDKFMGICYGCEKQHYMPHWKLQLHIAEHQDNSEWFKHWIEEISRPAQVDDLRYLGYEHTTYDFSENRAVSLICKIVHISDQKNDEFPTIVTECIPGNIRVLNNDIYTGSPPSILNRKPHSQISEEALDCLKHHECSFRMMGDHYLDQPFYKCRTCPSASNAGVCAICVVDCHFGHEVEIVKSNGNFCDCATSSIKLVGIKHCQAASVIHVTPFPAENKNSDSEVEVFMAIRGNLEVDVRVVSRDKNTKTFQYNIYQDLST